MAPALPDPNVAGPYKVALAQVDLSRLPSLQSAQLYLPSDDTMTLSPKAAMYPLVLMAPAQHMNPLQLGDYALRLASHGIVVALWQPAIEGDHSAYRSVGVNLLGSLLAGEQAAVAGHLDAARVGFAGYELGAAISVAIVSQEVTMMTPMAIRGLAVIEPKKVDALNNPIDFMAEMAKVKLTDTQPVLLIGEQKSNNSMDGLMPCTNETTNYLQFYAASKTATVAIDFAKAAQGEFTDSFPDPACLSGSTMMTMAPADTKRLAIKYLTAYFQWALLGRPEAQDYLTGSRFTADASQYSLKVTKMP